jgi:hypothetical protein
MYGLMKARICSQTAAQKQERRLHYCGTCKTIGNLYGQKARFLLNHDVVFLVEILSSLSANGPVHENWSRAYQSYNCLSIPREEKDMPLALQFAATANIVLTESKVKDQLSDSPDARWRFVNRVFSKQFLSASKKLGQWNFPLSELNYWLTAQDERERTATKVLLDAEESLFHFCEPTAVVTGMFFRHGAVVAGQSEVQDKMRALGFSFGRLIYLLDAFTDYERDARRGEFNAIQAAYKTKEEKLTDKLRHVVIQQLHKQQDEIISALNDLPLSNEKKEIFENRLRQNLASKLGQTLPLVQRACRAKVKRLTPSERLRQAVNAGSEMKAKHLAPSAKTFMARFQAPLIFVTVALIALVFPHQATRAKSWRECVGIGFNLMFLGAAFGAVIAPVKNIFYVDPNQIEQAAKQTEKMSKKKSSWCDGCDCSNCGDCCDCDCCECCSCCEDCSCCDGDCCSCDCGN